MNRHRVLHTERRSKELSDGRDTRTASINRLFHHRDTEETQRFAEGFSVQLCATSVSLW
jgi:hypothetical protein